MTGQQMGTTRGQHDALTTKTTPVDADEVVVLDSAASYGRKRLSWANALATLSAAISTLTNKSIDLANNTLTGTKAQFQTACSDDDFVTLAGSQTITGAKTFSTAPVLNALPTGTAVASAATASTIVTRDSGAAITAFNVNFTTTTIVTAAGSTTLTTSARYVRLTGTQVQDVVLQTSFIPTGFTVEFINDSTQIVTVKASAGATVQALAAGSTMRIVCISATPTTAAHWRILNIYP